MRLWWLSFKDGTTVIVRAETLVHARLLVAADKVARAHLFDAGFKVDPEFEQIIPDDLIGRTLSRNEAADLRKRLWGDGTVFARAAALTGRNSPLALGVGRRLLLPGRFPARGVTSAMTVRRRAIWNGG
jgi:hypothetical protein